MYTINRHLSEYNSNTCCQWAQHAFGMARLCVHCLHFPSVCSKCSVPLPWHLCCRWPIHAPDRGLRMGRLGDDKAKGSSRTSRLHHLQYVR